MEREKKYWLDDPANTRKVYIGLWVACVVVMLLDFLYHKHVHYRFEELPGFFSFYGFLGCVGLIFASIGLRKIVMRDEDYYDR